jgi:hypothetical protein
MSYFRKSGAGLDEQYETGAEPDELLHDADAYPAYSPRATFTELTGRVSRWFQGMDREPVEYGTQPFDPIAELTAGESQADSSTAPPRFPLVRFGYNQAVVDDRLAELERELDDRDRELANLSEQVKPPMSITEEIERIGEQTASILVVAHDQAHQTTRRAQEQAERCIADAAANAVAITAEAKDRLRELDDETDSVWRERERLLEDVRVVSASLASLVDEATSRFPADAEKSSAGPSRRL